MSENLIQFVNEFISVTEITSIDTISYFGKLQKEEADKAAVDRMRIELNKKNFQSRIIIGEGEKDNAPMLYEDEILGNGELIFDLAVDPLECTSNFAKGLPNSLSVIGFAEFGKLQRVPGTYMEQWIAGPKMKTAFQIELGIEKNIELLANQLNKKNSELRIVVQDRPRHKELISILRRLGCSICLIDSGSISCIISICLELGEYDALIGTFGAPEGIVGAIIAKCTNSEFKGILRPHEEKFKIKWQELGKLENQVLDKNDLVQGKNFGIIATCLSSNSFLKGIQKNGNLYLGETILILENQYKVLKFKRIKDE